MKPELPIAVVAVRGVVMVMCGIACNAGNECVSPASR